MIPELLKKVIIGKSITIGICLFMIAALSFAIGISTYGQHDIIPFYTDLNDYKNSDPGVSDSPNADGASNSIKDTDSKESINDNKLKFGGFSSPQFGRSSNHISTLLNNDTDGDGVIDDNDNCPTISNSDQKDSDNNGVGDVCDNDTQIPEFPSIALPMIAIIGLLFVMHRKN